MLFVNGDGIGSACLRYTIWPTVIKPNVHLLPDRNSNTVVSFFDFDYVHLIHWLLSFFNPCPAE